MRRFLPFLSWFPLSRESLKADLLAGIAVALVLVPQSMAYAQLAGMPAHYGLYASLLPVAVGALWGSSRQLATGPVAMVSLLTGSTLAQLAPPGGPQFVAYAIVLALMVGVLQLALGLARLGAIVNFLSHPVIAGFTNAAAIVHELIEARDEKRLLRLQRQLAAYKLLIVDELGFVPLSQTGAELLFEVFSQRYERGSTIVTSNLPFDEWTSVFGSERLTGALLDRLTHHVHILEMNGESYRLNQSKRRVRRPKPDTPPDDATQK